MIPTQLKRLCKTEYNVSLDNHVKTKNNWTNRVNDLANETGTVINAYESVMNVIIAEVKLDRDGTIERFYIDDLENIKEADDRGLGMEKIMIADTVQGILKEHKEKGTSQYSIVTKDEYILNFIKRFGGNKERATESFKNISQGYNFIFTIGDNQYYSVDYINKLLER